ncbi:unnamed protein product, partial [Polarella glacialis]
APPGTRGAPPAAEKNFFADLRAKYGAVCVDLLKKTLHLDPTLRITSDAVVSHEFFDQEPLACQPHEIKMPAPHMSCHELGVKKRREERDKELKEQQAALSQAPQSQ